MTRRPVLRSWRAEQDALAIWEYIAQDNFAAANDLLRRMDEKIDLLSESPELGERLAGSKNHHRRIIVGNYLVFYQVLDDAVRVIRILHAARRWEDLL